MTDFAGAAGSIFSAFGDFAEAAGYNTAASLEKQNAGYERLSGEIQLTAQNRQIYQTIGAEEAGTGANGLTNSGSALSVLRSSQQQAGLQRGLTELQTNINVNSSLERAAADSAQATAKTIGGIGGIISGALGLFGI
jgi:hypothetical protein